MTAPDARDQQVLNRPACALSASVLTRMPEGARGLHRRADIQHSLAMARLPGLADSFPRNRAERFSRRGPAFRRGLQFPVVEQGHKAPVELVLPIPRRLVVYQDDVKLTYRQGGKKCLGKAAIKTLMRLLLRANGASGCKRATAQYRMRDSPVWLASATARSA